MQTRLLYYFLSSSNFSLFERKVTKEANKPAAWPACEYGNRIPQSPLDSARKHNAEALLLFAWRKGISPLVVLWMTLIVWRLFFWCAEGTASPQEPIWFPRSLYEGSTHCCSTGFYCKAYWGLNKTVGIFVVPSMHPARSARLPYALYNDKEPRATKFLSSSK